ncbi:probable pectinesterase/pectinesterase inhibitor 61 [Amaranthus tricolor]|uniref:probable pectinesterase/pectinesterase inhibitor 61 n=1 Tax=Amaranthus tricolor TaxID=29722 RepID=UPI0025883D57|nr:probable pectinesterase/pectinesterase inhibitor 61 [Amaranthus tricolor]
MEGIFSTILLPFTIFILMNPNPIMCLNVRAIPTPNDNKEEKNSTNTLIEKACNNAKYKELCMETLKSHPGSETADLKSLAFMALNKTKTYGNKVSDIINSMIENGNSMGPGIEQALSECDDQYDDANVQTDNSLVAFFANAFKDVNTFITTAIKNAETCEDYVKKGNATKVLGDKNKVFAQYCTNALAVVHVLAQTKN